MRFADLYASYVEWAEASGEKPENKRRFGDSLSERGYPAANGAKNTAIRRGIGLREEEKG